MAFRNPLRSLPFSAITGLIDASQIDSVNASAIVGFIAGSQLAAESIDGKTITGPLVRTAASGERMEMNSALGNGLLGYTGSSYESAPAGLSIGSFAAGDLFEGAMRLYGPEISGVVAADIILIATTILPVSGLPGSRVALSADEGSMGPLQWSNGLLELTGPLVDIPGKITGQPYTASDSVVDTPNGAGQLVIDYGVTFTEVRWPTVSAGSSGGLSVAGTGTSTSAGIATLTDAAGALVTTGLRRVNWSVTGILA